MFRLIRPPCLLLPLLIVVTLSGAPGRSAADTEVASRAAAGRRPYKRQDLSGKYIGTVFFPAPLKSGKGFLIKGPATTLEIKPEIPENKDKGERFTFSNTDHTKTVVGYIKTWLDEENDRGVGNIHVDGELRSFEITWHRNPMDKTVFKVLRVYGARARNFRFCSTTLADQCADQPKASKPDEIVTPQ